ncbi:MAG TPA: hypothetical protein DCR93_35655 [Cytophagales bacterium]|nr:hypothetical protein [Cytophagales bacterium]HAP64598.1 hypothetical protein [Cytophagales bacterium]
MQLRTLLLLVLAWVSVTARAQQLPTYNMYAQNLFTINPAFAGYWQGTNGYLYAKSIFNGLPNTPQQLDLGVHQAIETMQAAFGGRLVIDERSAFQTFQLSATASYKLPVTREQLFSVALEAGFVNRSFNPLEINDFTDPNDPVLSSEYYNQTNFRFAAGVAYISPMMEIGVSMPQLIEGGERINPHINAFAAGNFFTGEFLIKPSIFGQYLPDGSLVGDINVMAEYAQTLWIQPGFRTNMTVLLSAGFMFEKAQLGYSFSLYAGSYEYYQGNAHELMLSFLINDGGRQRAFIDRLNPYQRRGIQKLFRRR